MEGPGCRRAIRSAIMGELEQPQCLDVASERKAHGDLVTRHSKVCVKGTLNGEMFDADAFWG